MREVQTVNARSKLAVGVSAVAALNERLTGYEEVPALSTSGNGKFRASIRPGDGEKRQRAELSHT